MDDMKKCLPFEQFFCQLALPEQLPWISESKMTLGCQSKVTGA